MIRKRDGSIVLESLDELLTPEDCALWLGLELEALQENVRARRIEVLKINSRVHRFHPRSILIGLGVPREALPQYLARKPELELKARRTQKA